ncbi:metallophosphoesterase [Nibricoccus sp. IMCC34717]|uniref:metallophosphoesterase n=1 Tax=Nibricoccus sp. IMCC34717 TaxID=3034021 RepID=UPI00384AD84B
MARPWHPRVPGLTRILSDLHLYDADSRLATPEQVLPLLRGVSHLVLNGDTLDTQRTPDGDAKAEAFRHWLEQYMPEVTFITGNHDPVVSDTHELSLAGGAVWVFHGDLLYEAIAPWSAIGGQLRREVLRRRRAGGLGTDSSFEELMAVHRSVCRDIHVEFDVTRKDKLYRAWRAARTLLPPTRFWRMMRVWQTMPQASIAFAKKHRPSASFVVTGHCHAPSLQEFAGVRAINTGSFCRPRGGHCVDLAGGELVVRRIDFASPDGARASEAVARFSVP